MDTIHFHPHQGHNRTLPAKATTSAQKNARSQPGPGPGKKQQRSLQSGKMRMFRHINGVNKAIRTFRTAGVLVSSAGGAITAFNIGSASVTSAPDWANFSQEFGAYRVKEMKFKIFPSTTSATATTGPYQSCLCMSRYWGFLPTTISHVAQDPDMKSFSTLQEGAITTNYLGFEPATLYTPVGVALSADKLYGFGGCSLTNVSVLPVSSNIFSFIHEHIVEFVSII